MGSDASRYSTFIGYDTPLLGDPGDYREGVDQESEAYQQTLAIETGLLTRLGYTEDEAKAVFDDALTIDNSTYGVKEGDGMYLPPEDRILVWD